MTLKRWGAITGGVTLGSFLAALVTTLVVDR